MKLPALRSKIGSREFYIATLTFQQVADHVERIDDKLYVSKGLSDLLQRNISANAESICNYILNQPDIFFNSLVLAVYDNYPTWHQVVVKTEEDEYLQIGLLDFPGTHKIFPIDGQHRVEGIKAALEKNPDLADQQVGAIFIGHEHTEEGRKKTRRVFTTLNRYAKPISQRDGIVFDEDDTVAIVTRELLEEFDLFQGRRILDDQGKPIPPTNTEALTSLVSLYQCNMEVYKDYRSERDKKRPTKKSLEQALRFRPERDELDSFKKYLDGFWSAMKNQVEALSTFVATPKNAAAAFRSQTNGGHVLFRPAGLLPFVKVALRLRAVEESFEKVFSRMKSIPLALDAAPWQSVLWNHLEKKMITNSSKLVHLLMLWYCDPTSLTSKEQKQLREGYASRVGLEQNPDQALDGLKGSR